MDTAHAEWNLSKVSWSPNNTDSKLRVRGTIRAEPSLHPQHLTHQHLNREQSSLNSTYPVPYTRPIFTSKYQSPSLVVDHEIREQTKHHTKLDPSQKHNFQPDPALHPTPQTTLPRRLSVPQNTLHQRLNDRQHRPDPPHPEAKSQTTLGKRLPYPNRHSQQRLNELPLHHNSQPEISNTVPTMFTKLVKSKINTENPGKSRNTHPHLPRPPQDLIKPKKEDRKRGSAKRTNYGLSPACQKLTPRSLKSKSRTVLSPGSSQIVESSSSAFSKTFVNSNTPIDIPMKHGPKPIGPIHMDATKRLSTMEYFDQARKLPNLPDCCYTGVCSGYSHDEKKRKTAKVKPMNSIPTKVELVAHSPHPPKPFQRPCETTVTSHRIKEKKLQKSRSFCGTTEHQHYMRATAASRAKENPTGSCYATCSCPRHGGCSAIGFAPCVCPKPVGRPWGSAESLTVCSFDSYSIASPLRTPEATENLLPEGKVTTEEENPMQLQDFDEHLGKDRRFLKKPNESMKVLTAAYSEKQSLSGISPALATIPSRPTPITPSTSTPHNKKQTSRQRLVTPSSSTLFENNSEPRLPLIAPSSPLLRPASRIHKVFVEKLHVTKSSSSDAEKIPSSSSGEHTYITTTHSNPKPPNNTQEENSSERERRRDNLRTSEGLSLIPEESLEEGIGGKPRSREMFGAEQIDYTVTDQSKDLTFVSKDFTAEEDIHEQLRKLKANSKTLGDLRMVGREDGLLENGGSRGKSGKDEKRSRMSTRDDPVSELIDEDSHHETVDNPHFNTQKTITPRSINPEVLPPDIRFPSGLTVNKPKDQLPLFHDQPELFTDPRTQHASRKGSSKLQHVPESPHWIHHPLEPPTIFHVHSLPDIENFNTVSVQRNLLQHNKDSGLYQRHEPINIKETIHGNLRPMYPSFNADLKQETKEPIIGNHQPNLSFNNGPEIAKVLVEPVDCTSGHLESSTRSDVTETKNNTTATESSRSKRHKENCKKNTTSVSYPKPASTKHTDLQTQLRMHSQPTHWAPSDHSGNTYNRIIGDLRADLIADPRADPRVDSRPVTVRKTAHDHIYISTQSVGGSQEQLAEGRVDVMVKERRNSLINRYTPEEGRLSVKELVEEFEDFAEVPVLTDQQDELQQSNLKRSNSAILQSILDLKEEIGHSNDRTKGEEERYFEDDYLPAKPGFTPCETESVGVYTSSTDISHQSKNSPCYSSASSIEGEPLLWTPILPPLAKDSAQRQLDNFSAVTSPGERFETPLLNEHQVTMLASPGSPYGRIVGSPRGKGGLQRSPFDSQYMRKSSYAMRSPCGTLAVPPKETLAHAQRSSPQGVPSGSSNIITPDGYPLGFDLSQALSPSRNYAQSPIYPAPNEFLDGGNRSPQDFPIFASHDIPENGVRSPQAPPYSPKKHHIHPGLRSPSRPPSSSNLAHFQTPISAPEFLRETKVTPQDEETASRERSLTFHSKRRNEGRNIIEERSSEDDKIAGLSKDQRSKRKDERHANSKWGVIEERSSEVSLFEKVENISKSLMSLVGLSGETDNIPQSNKLGSTPERTEATHPSKLQSDPTGKSDKLADLFYENKIQTGRTAHNIGANPDKQKSITYSDQTLRESTSDNFANEFYEGKKENTAIPIVPSFKNVRPLHRVNQEPPQQTPNESSSDYLTNIFYESKKNMHSPQVGKDLSDHVKLKETSKVGHHTNPGYRHAESSQCQYAADTIPQNIHNAHYSQHEKSYPDPDIPKKAHRNPEPTLYKHHESCCGRYKRFCEENSEKTSNDQKSEILSREPKLSDFKKWTPKVSESISEARSFSCCPTDTSLHDSANQNSFKQETVTQNTVVEKPKLTENSPVPNHYLEPSYPEQQPENEPEKSKPRPDVDHVHQCKPNFLEYQHQPHLIDQYQQNHYNYRTYHQSAAQNYWNHQWQHQNVYHYPAIQHRNPATQQRHATQQNHGSQQNHDFQLNYASQQTSPRESRKPSTPASTETSHNLLPQAESNPSAYQSHYENQQTSPTFRDRSNTAKHCKICGSEGACYKDNTYLNLLSIKNQLGEPNSITPPSGYNPWVVLVNQLNCENRLLMYEALLDLVYPKKEVELNPN